MKRWGCKTGLFRRQNERFVIAKDGLKSQKAEETIYLRNRKKKTPSKKNDFERHLK